MNPHLYRNAHRKVRYTLMKPDELCSAVLDHACQGREEWTLEEWCQLVTRIESDDRIISEWIDDDDELEEVPGLENEIAFQQLEAELNTYPN
jgi:hypothetical protein